MLSHTKVYSVFAQKCPRCHEGDLFTHSNPYNLGQLADMPDNCPVCGENFRREPGFYYGAMYVSYALTVALSVAVFVAMYAFASPHWKWYLLTNAITILILFPVLFRWSRAIWINLFVHFKSPEERMAMKADKSGGR